MPDDEGLFVYTQFVAQATGAWDPDVALRRLAVVLFGILVFAYPLVFYELFDSLAAAAVAPLVVFWKLLFGAGWDVYWFASWILLAALPLVLLCLRHRGSRWTPLALTTLALLGGLASAMRASAGLPVLVSAVIVALLMHARSWRIRAVVVVVLVVAYASIGTAAFGALRADRDHALGNDRLSSQYSNSHLTWHPAYLGLGYIDNAYGLSWHDAVGIRAARRVDPHVAVFTKHYDGILRRLYVRFVRSHPTYVVHDYAAKLGTTLLFALLRFPLLLFVIAAAVTVGKRRRQARLDLAVVAPALAITAVSPVVGYPAVQYELGWLGAVGLLWLLALTTLVAEGEDVVYAAVDGKLAAPQLQLRRPRRSVLLAVAALAVVLLASLTGIFGWTRSEREAAAYRREQSPLLPPIGEPAAWSTTVFGGPLGWRIQGAGQTRKVAGGLAVVTGPEPNGYTIVSPPKRLAAGSYRVEVDGSVQRGGLMVGVLDLATDRWLDTRVYSHLSVAFGTRRMWAQFRAPSPRLVRVILMNSRTKPEPSTWIVRSVAVKPVGLFQA